MTGRLERFFANIQLDFRTFGFFLVMLCCMRLFFIWYFSTSLAASTGAAEVASANFAGLRLSMKSAGVFTAFGFLFVTVIGGLLLPKRDFGRVRLFFGYGGIVLLNILFGARFPYYRAFHAGFGQEIVDGLYDDHGAIFSMAMEEYQLLPRLVLALVITAAVCYLYRRWLQLPLAALPAIADKHKVLSGIFSLVFVVTAFIFIRFGGSFNYEHSINWENAAVTSDGFLNEMILDDVQGLYRAKAFYDQMAGGRIYGVEPENLPQYLALVSGNKAAGETKISPYLLHQAQGATIAKPKHIFIILGESWADWPLLDKYKDLHVADGLKKLAQRPDAYRSDVFMSNGSFTSVAITGMVTGLSEVGIKVNYQPRTIKEVYPTAMAESFHRLGYKVDFWYGGFPDWDNIKKMSLAQGFDAFYGCPDYNGKKQSIWGTTDGELFKALYSHLAEEEPTVHLIMTTTNHPPYNLDLAAEGFDVAQEEAKVRELIPDAEDPHELAIELGHYWYMDKVVSDFVKETIEQYPDSLFVITGDHAVRMDPGPNASLYEHAAVPFVLVGQGINANILPAAVSGGHTAIVPTLLELIAPQGFKYYSLAHSLTEGNQPAFNREVWLTGEAIGVAEGKRQQNLAGENGTYTAEQEKVLPWLKAMRTISWQLIMKGDTVGE